MKYDLAVIGGGPAGLMAALIASESGRRVILLEKNARPGIKLLMTGGGRCNITNDIPDYHLLAASFGASGRFLLSAFSRFGSSELRDFFASRGLATKIEKINQVFPASDKASDVLDIFVRGIKAAGGLIMTGSPVQDIVLSGQSISHLVLADGSQILATDYLLATGGLSYPVTGSSGDGYKWLRALGHKVITPRPALAPIIASDKFIKDLEGLSLDGVSLSLYSGTKKIASASGPVLFTAVGLSGPAALNISRFIDLGRVKNYRLEIDLQPALSLEETDRHLVEILSGNNKLLKNSLEGLVPARLAEALVFLSGISPDKGASSLTRGERGKLAGLLKALPLRVVSIGSYDRAMVTAGGADLSEVDPRTMRSKKITNLLLAGEILDLAGPTGGYNLQLCWSTGYVAGSML